MKTPKNNSNNHTQKSQTAPSQKKPQPTNNKTKNKKNHKTPHPQTNKQKAQTKWRWERKWILRSRETVSVTCLRQPGFLVSFRWGFCFFCLCFLKGGKLNCLNYVFTVELSGTFSRKGRNFSKAPWNVNTNDVPDSPTSAALNVCGAILSKLPSVFSSETVLAYKQVL